MSTLDSRSLDLRRLIVRALDGARRGHIGPSMSLVEMLRVLYDDFLNFRSTDPSWAERDRLILSKGHGCLALYAILADKGFFPIEVLDTFADFDSPLGGHPERGPVPGVEASTGALGHGLSIGVGMALAARIKGLRHKVVVIVGDGELNEGACWEAIASAAQHGLSNLYLMVDRNFMQCYGNTNSVVTLEPLREKFDAFAWRTAEVDGHDPAALRKALTKFADENESAPSVIICNTVKGKGIPNAESEPSWHYRFVLTDDDIDNFYSALTVTQPQ
jgi:transketolase